jgi:hypothetical protein
MNSLTVADLMKNVTTIPELYQALQEYQRAGDRLAQLAKESEKEIEKMQVYSTFIRNFFGEGIAVEPTQPKYPEPGTLKLPSGIDPTKLPAIPPKRRYQQVVALLEAAPEGLSFPEIRAAWKELCWTDWESPKLARKIHDAIKTAEKFTDTNIKHAGGRNGKYQILK